MSRRLVTLALTALIAFAASAPAAAGAATGPRAEASSYVLTADVAVGLDRSTLSTRVGERFSFTSSLRNEGERPIPGLIAHLNIVSLDPDVYVDPEDWSTSRTRYVGAISARASIPLEWTVQAVNSGRFLVYVAVAEQPALARVTSGEALQLTVAEQRTLNAGGILPLAAALPAALLVLMGLAARRRRRLR